MDETVTIIKTVEHTVNLAATFIARSQPILHGY